MAKYARIKSFLYFLLFIKYKCLHLHKILIYCYMNTLFNKIKRKASKAGAWTLFDDICAVLVALSPFWLMLLISLLGSL